MLDMAQVDRGDAEGEVVEADVDSSDDDIEIDEDEKTLSLIECKQGVEDLIKSMLNLLQSDSFSNIQEQTDTRLWH